MCLKKHFLDQFFTLFMRALMFLLLTSLILLTVGCTQTEEVYILVQILEDKGNWEHVPIPSAQVMGTISDERAVEPLIAALADEDPQISEAAAEALQELVEAGEPVVEPLIAALESEKTEARKKSADLDMDEERVVSLLTAAMEEENLVLVAKAHLYYIRKGERQTEDTLVEALNQHGWKRMAENFLNSGNSRLEKAARDWAEKHGYRVVSRLGDGGVGWGN